MNQDQIRKTRISISVVCFPVLVLLAYRPFWGNPWFVDSLAGFSWSAGLFSLHKVAHLMLFVGLGALIPLHHWISDRDLDLRSISGAVLFCLFPFLDFLVHFSFGLEVIAFSLCFWSLLGIGRLLSLKYLAVTGCLVIAGLTFAVGPSFLFLNGCWSLFYLFQTHYPKLEKKKLDYFLLFFLIMMEMVTLQLRQLKLGQGQNWTLHVAGNLKDNANLVQTLSMRDIVEIEPSPEDIFVSEGEKSELIKNVHHFKKSTDIIELKADLEDFIGSVHTTLSMNKPTEDEKWFWLFLTRAFYQRSLKVKYDDFGRLFVIFYHPMYTLFNDLSEFEFFGLKYREKVFEQYKQVKDGNFNIDDSSYINFLEKEAQKLEADK